MKYRHATLLTFVIFALFELGALAACDLVDAPSTPSPISNPLATPTVPGIAATLELPSSSPVPTDVATTVVSSGTTTSTPTATALTSVPTNTPTLVEIVHTPTRTAILAVTVTPPTRLESTPEDNVSEDESTPATLPTQTRPVSEAATPAASAEEASPTTHVGDTLQYYFPVEPASAASYGSSHHDYPATDIFCPIGSRFVAPVSGTVDFVSRVDIWDPADDDPSVRGGISVAIIGDDNVRYYGSHLSSIAAGIEVGVRVEGGQLLGMTGKSGNARFVDPHVHFGISHPTVPDDWKVRRGEISPYKYLNAWKQGRNVTPELSP